MPVTMLLFLVVVSSWIGEEFHGMQTQPGIPSLPVEEGLPSCCASTAWRSCTSLPHWPVRRTGPQRLADEAVMVARRLPALGFLVMALTRAGETALLSGRQPQATLRELIGHPRDLGAQAWVVETLEMAALLREAQGRPRPHPAARLLGACRALKEALGEAAQGRVLAGEVSACRRRLAESLGHRALAEEEAFGHSMAMAEGSPTHWRS